MGKTTFTLAKAKKFFFISIAGLISWAIAIFVFLTFVWNYAKAHSIAWPDSGEKIMRIKFGKEVIYFVLSPEYKALFITILIILMVYGSIFIFMLMKISTLKCPHCQKQVLKTGPNSANLTLLFKNSPICPFCNSSLS